MRHDDESDLLRSVPPEQLRDHLTQSQADVDALRERVRAQQARILKLEAERETLRARTLSGMLRRRPGTAPSPGSGSTGSLPPWTAPSDKPRVAAVLDPLSRSCFSPEMGIADLTPDNWQSVLEGYQPDLLLVESVFNGPGKAWPGIVARYGRPHQVFEEIVSAFRSAGVPCVFWNKEDPPNYPLFIASASLFDHVFTVDADMVPRYRTDLGHSRIHTLPFAAQPAIHHPPCDEAERTGSVAFAGSYYASKHPDRRDQMEYVLDPALEFGLDIYDRMAPIADPRFDWPERYLPAVRGSVPVDEMPVLYRRYKVFLNVNTVTNSPTMMARRIYELAASGTAVVSGPSAAVEAVVPDEIVTVVQSPDATRRALTRLLGDRRAREPAAVAGPEWIADGNTYRHRLETILAVL